MAKPIYLKFSLLQKFQFAWRFLSLAVLPPAIFAGALIYLLPKKLKLPMVYCLLILMLFLNRSFWHAKAFLHQEEAFFTGPYPSPTDTGESAPRWSVRFMEDFPQAPIEVIEGEAEIKEIRRLTAIHEFKVEARTESRLMDNTLYFPNWQVLINGRPTEVEFQDPNYRGLMTFWVEPGKHQVKVIFKETRLRLLADVVSLISIAFLVLGGKIWVRIFSQKK